MQSVYPDINPNTTSGTQLATLLNSFKASILTNHSGASAPSYAVQGSQWFDSTTSAWIFKFYDGAQWVSQFTLDTVAHTISYGGNNPTSSFRADRTDTSDDMIEMYRNTQVQTHGGLIYSQKNDADVKKTFGKIKVVAESVANAAERASMTLDVLVAGALTQIAKLEHNALTFKALEGVGERDLYVNSSGVIQTRASSGGSSSLFGNGSAKSADTATYTAVGLSFATSTDAGDLIDSTSVFSAESTLAAQTLTTQVITLKNANIDDNLIISLKHKNTTDWTVEVIDNTAATLKTYTLPAYSPTLDEARVSKLFVYIPSTSTSITVKFTSTAADILLFDDLKLYSWMDSDEPLYFKESIGDNQTNANLFKISTKKYNMYRIEGSIIRTTTTEDAAAIYNSTVAKSSAGVAAVRNESVLDVSTDLVGVTLDMSSNQVRYSSSDLTGASHAGTFQGKITPIL